MGGYKDKVDQVVLQIFANLGAADGSQVLLENLRREWSTLKRRPDELIDAVRRLIFAGVLEVAHTSIGTALVLSPNGRVRATALTADVRNLWNLGDAAAFAPQSQPPGPMVVPG